MRLKGYYEFLIESILLTSNSLTDIIKSIDDPIAQKFSDLINKDIKTKFNIINLTDANDKLSFIPDSQATTKIKSGIDPSDLFNDKGNQTTIGRVVRGILTDNNIPYVDREIEKFVNKFKSAYESSKIKDKDSEPIKVVKGEEIRYWYLSDNYCQSTLNGKGSLGKSCMRYQSCQQFLDIYVNNPDQVSLVIYVDENNKLKSRALLWETDKGKHLDRIYYTDDSEVNLVDKWVNDNFEINRKRYSNIEITLTGKSNPDGSYDYYPYMDTFMYYYAPEKKLYNSEPSVSNRKKLYELQDTGGYGQSMDTVYCEYEDENYSSDQVVYSDYLNSYLHRDNAVYSRHAGTYIWADNSSYSEALDDYYPEDEAVLVYLDDEKRNHDFYPNDYEDITFDELENVYFLSSLMVLDDDGNSCLKKNLIKIVKILPESIEKYKEIYNIPKYWWNDEDGKLIKVQGYEKYGIESLLSKYQESDHYANPIDAELFDIKLDSTQSKNLSNKKFFNSNYSFMLYSKLEKMLDGLDSSKAKQDKNEEIGEVDDFLGKTGSIFDSRNQIYKLGIDQFDALWKATMSENFEDCFDEIYRHQVGYRSMRGLINKYVDFKSMFKKLTKDLLENPKEFILAYYQSDNKKSDTSKIDSIIFDTFTNSKNSEDDLSNIVQLTIRIYSRLMNEVSWQSFQSIRWARIYDNYLKNQKAFVDVIKQ